MEFDGHAHTHTVWDCVFMLDSLPLNNTEKYAEAKKKKQDVSYHWATTKKTQLLSNCGTLVTITLCNLYSHYRSQNNNEKKGLHGSPSTRSSFHSAGCMHINTFYINISHFFFIFLMKFHWGVSICSFKFQSEFAEQCVFSFQRARPVLRCRDWNRKCWPCWAEQRLCKPLWKSSSK